MSCQKHFAIRIHAGGDLCIFPSRGMIKQKCPGVDRVKHKSGVLAIGIWNVIEERVSYECIDLLMKKSVFYFFKNISFDKMENEIINFQQF